ncbi:leukotriene B4 receptor 1 [Pangasianodon hypophthalmus]|uniref:leukotriene B4 receptor 1 n=1 Tax=Pangasianodon hypophthalmus TaxID=310915 RepID=UPI000EFEF2E5|nr:leukotriene B4 receptor 1 [Pangasianodon hypophthalmus]
MNSSSYSSYNSTVSGDEWATAGGAVACVILSVCFVVGTPGNLLVMWTIMRHVKQRSHTLLLIMHLAVADMLVVVTLPLWIYSLAWSWVFGEAACKAMVYVIYACMYASVFLITIMSVERYLSVRYPFKMLHWKNSNAMNLILAGGWTLALLLGLPAFLTQSLNESMDGVQHCFFSEFGSVALEVFCACLETLIGFVIPFLTLAVCYVQVAAQLRQMHKKNKQKSAFLVSGVVVAFALCWLPHHVMNVINVAQLLGAHSEKLAEVSEAAVFISGALTFISSSVNPMLYAFAARNFQGSLRKSAMAKLFQEIASYTVQLRGAELQTSDCLDQDTLKKESAADV